MIKTLTNLLKQDKEKFVVPKGVQDCIPITAIYDDGIFRVGKDKYSKSFKFTDINYAVASREDIWTVPTASNTISSSMRRPPRISLPMLRSARNCRFTKPA